MKLDDKDVGMTEDMVFALKNLIAIEDHAINSFNMSEDKKWLEVCDTIRKIRTKWISLIVKKEESHIWCISKHLLASYMGMVEVGNRFLSVGQDKESKEAFKDANTLYLLFLLLNDVTSDGKIKSSA